MVVNCAATTVFDERYDRALRINTVGARDVASFAAGCRNLQVGWLASEERAACCGSRGPLLWVDFLNPATGSQLYC